MGYQEVKARFEELGWTDRLVIHETTGDTVEHAAETVGCTPAEVAKTLSFLVDGSPVLVVMAGDTRINSSKFKKFFHQKPSMVPRDQVEDLTGHPPGGVSPFAFKEGVPLYLDESLKRFDTVYPAAGAHNITTYVSPAEIEQYGPAVGWVDICKIVESE